MIRALKFRVNHYVSILPGFMYSGCQFGILFLHGCLCVDGDRGRTSLSTNRCGMEVRKKQT